MTPELLSLTINNLFFMTPVKLLRVYDSRLIGGQQFPN